MTRKPVFSMVEYFTSVMLVAALVFYIARAT